jgi:hypothetical protein
MSVTQFVKCFSENMIMTRPLGPFISSLLTASLLLAPSSFALDLSLSEEAVREAYFLGQRNDENTAQVLAPYTRHLALPEKGPYVSAIKLSTPYVQVIDASRQRTGYYSAQEAQQDYRERGDTILVSIRIEFTATYGYPQAVASANNAGKEQGVSRQPQDFWKDFCLGLSQHGKWIDPRAGRAEAVYDRGEGGLGGAVVWLEFDAHEVASTETSVEVETPDGQHILATFDLSHLR